MRLTIAAAAALIVTAGLAAGVRRHGGGTGGVRPPPSPASSIPPSRRRCAPASTSSCATRCRPRVDAPVALVVPHAGYIYSGQIAADAYRQAGGRRVDTVVILGTNHTSGTFRRVSVYRRRRLPHPARRGPRRPRARRGAGQGGRRRVRRDLHAREHSVEVQVPFVQHLFPHAAIVPVVVGVARPRVVPPLRPRARRRSRRAGAC